MKKNGPWASREQDDHLNRPIPNVLSSTPAGENIGCCVPANGGGRHMGGDIWGGGGRHISDWGGEDARNGDGSRKDTFKADPSWSDTRDKIKSHPSEKRKGRKRCWGEVGRDVRGCRRGGMGFQGGRSVSAVGHWELQLALNVLQQSQSRENNIGRFINLIIVPRQTPVSVFTPLLIFPFPPVPHQLSLSPSDSLCNRGPKHGKRKSPWLWTNSMYWQWPTHNRGNGD